MTPTSITSALTLAREAGARRGEMTCAVCGTDRACVECAWVPVFAPVAALAAAVEALVADRERLAHAAVALRNAMVAADRLDTSFDVTLALTRLDAALRDVGVDPDALTGTP